MSCEVFQPAPPAPARTWLAGARPVGGGENDDGSARAVAGRRRWASPEPALAYPSPSSEEGSSQRGKGGRGAPVRPVVARVVERRQSLQAAAVKAAAEEGEWRPAAAAPRVPRMKASGGRSATPAAAQPADDDGPEAATAHRGRGRDPSVGSVGGASSSSSGGGAPAAALRVAVAKGKGEAERAAPAPSKATAAATVPAVLRRQKRPIFEENKADPPGGGACGEERHGWGALPLYLSGAVALLLLWQVLAPFLHSPAGAGGAGAAPPRGASGAPPQRFQPAGLILRQGARVPSNPLGSAGAAAAAAASGSSSRGLLASADGLAARVVADGAAAAAAGGSCALRLQREAEPGNGLHGKPLSQPQVIWEVPHKLSVLGAGKEKLHSLWKKGSDSAASAIVDKANNTGSPLTLTDVCIAELSSEGVLALKKGKKTIWKSRKPFKTSVPGMFSLALSSNRLVIMKGEVVLTTVATFTEP